MGHIDGDGMILSRSLLCCVFCFVLRCRKLNYPKSREWIYLYVDVPARLSCGHSALLLFPYFEESVDTAVCTGENIFYCCQGKRLIFALFFLMLEFCEMDEMECTLRLLQKKKIHDFFYSAIATCARPVQQRR